LGYFFTKHLVTLDLIKTFAGAYVMAAPKSGLQREVNTPMVLAKPLCPSAKK
jgi:hypothetical protein